MFAARLCRSALSLSTSAMRTQARQLPKVTLPASAPFQQNSVRGMANHRHKKLIKQAKGYTGRTNCYTVALQRVTKAKQYAYIGRKLKKRQFRRLWIQRINAGSRMYGVKYNEVIHKMSCSNVRLNRNVLSQMAMTEPLSFRAVLEVVDVVAKKARHARRSAGQQRLTLAVAEAIAGDASTATEAAAATA